MTARQLDQQRQESFAGRMLDVLNGGSLVFLTSVGHKTGLFDTMSQLPPSTSEEIAHAAGLDERYVREWLGGMVVGGFVEYDPKDRSYYLPPEHAAVLTRAAGHENFAVFAQYYPLIGQVEEQVVASFRTGGGVPYSAYPRFQELQVEETGPVFDAVLVDVVLPFAAGIPERLEAGIDVLDVACGAGHAVNVMAKTYPNSRVMGIDFSEEGIALAREEAERLGLENARFEVSDAANVTGKYDLITTFDTVHDMARPAETLSVIRGALRDGGVFLVGDIAASSVLEENKDHPLGPTLFTFSVFHCMTVSLSQGGPGLGTVWGEQRAQEMLREAGFGSVEVNHIEGDPMHVYYVCGE
jgi:2-polyprenyl-3-methyl-5-hydroxy-6-metoxy-1,4-benzoquinol methylase